jgi:hypothetical protein
MIVFVSVWDTIDKIKVCIKHIKINSDISRIVILAQHEWAYHQFVNLGTAFEEIVTAAKDLPIDIIAGSHSLSPVFYDVSNPRYKNIKIHYWPTYWATCFGSSAPGELIPQSIDKLFCLLNGNAHRHRCLTMDLLCRDNLLDKGYISWYDFKNPENYEFKYWQPTALTLDTFSRARNLFTVPSEYARAFVNIVSESNMSPYFFTEKTTKPLYYKKPFLVISKEGYHTKMLVELGFKLYDEVFDYSFDTIEDYTLRTEHLIQQIKKLENYSNEQLEDITRQIEHKLEFNRLHLLSLMNNEELWPAVILELINDEYFQNNELFTMYNYYKNIKENS